MSVDDSLRSAMAGRKTTRKIERRQLPSGAFDDLVWAAVGHTHDYNDIKMRTAPSAGATYPVEMFFMIEDVEGYPDGIYYYDRSLEELRRTCQGRFLEGLRDASYEQDFVMRSNVAALMVYDPGKIEPDYGPNSLKYALLECGHIAQNLLLMATALGLGAIPVGAFDGKAVDGILGLDQTMTTQYFISIGAIKSP